MAKQSTRPTRTYFNLTPTNFLGVNPTPLPGSTKITISNVKVTDAGYYQCKARSQDGYSLLSRVSEVLIKHTSFESTVVSSDGVVTNKGKSGRHVFCFFSVIQFTTFSRDLYTTRIHSDMYEHFQCQYAVRVALWFAQNSM